MQVCYRYSSQNREEFGTAIEQKLHHMHDEEDGPQVVSLKVVPVLTARQKAATLSFAIAALQRELAHIAFEAVAVKQYGQTC